MVFVRGQATVIQGIETVVFFPLIGQTVAIGIPFSGVGFPEIHFPFTIFIRILLAIAQSVVIGVQFVWTGFQPRFPGVDLPVRPAPKVRAIGADGVLGDGRSGREAPAIPVHPAVFVGILS